MTNRWLGNTQELDVTTKRALALYGGARPYEVRRPYSTPARGQRFPKIPLRIAMKYGLMQTKFPRTYSFHPLPSYFYLSNYAQAGFSSELSDCVVCSCDMNPLLPKSKYTARLSNPIVIQTDMPGEGHVLTHAEIQAQINLGWGTWIAQNDRHFKVDNNGSTTMWKVDGDRINFGGGSLFKNLYGTADDPLAIDLSSFSKINVEFQNYIDVWTGGFTTYIGRPSITVMYAPTVPPEPATVEVRVRNRKTGQPIKDAFVQILAGTVIVAEENTNSDGLIIFENIPGGMTGISYTIDINASNFHEYTETITVKPGENAFSYDLVPEPVSPYLEWIKYGAIAAAVVGGVYTAGTVIKKREETKFVVVR